MGHFVTPSMLNLVPSAFEIVARELRVFEDGSAAAAAINGRRAVSFMVEFESGCEHCLENNGIENGHSYRIFNCSLIFAP